MISLVSCQKNDTYHQIYQHLEETVQLELGYSEQQKEISKLEKEEQEIYENISELEDKEDVKELIDEAVDNIDKRLDKINLEKESMLKAQEEFKKTRSLIDEIKNDEPKEIAEELYQVMIKRYELYEGFHKAYVDFLKHENDLYKTLGEEEATQDEYRDKIAKRNDAYKKVTDKNEIFNEHTNLYNSLKKQFYEAADMNVVYENE